VSNEFEDLNSLLGENAGGSEAARAFRKQLILQGEKLDVEAPISTLRQRPEPREDGDISSVAEARTAERRIVSGRAKLTMGGLSVNKGKMVDISTSGACVLMDDQVAAGKTATLECDIFMEGKRYVFSVPVVTVYGLLVAGKGFKIGVKFGPHGHDVASKIEELLRL
jgi:hypothetical protein